MANKIVTKFGPHLKELRLHFCLKGESSEGVRYVFYCLQLNWFQLNLINSQFIGKHYASVKQMNPNLPILCRESQGIEPKLWARFGITIISIYFNFLFQLFYIFFLQSLVANRTLHCLVWMENKFYNKSKK